MEYSTNRNKLILPEYGRNIQKMVEYASAIEDKEKRNLAAQEIINIMGSMNPHLRDINDFKHKLWDQLMLMSDFKINIESPFPIPEKEFFEEKPKRVEYTGGNLKYRYLGRIMQKLILAATEIEDEEKKAELVKIITNHMKKSYLLWNKDIVEDKLIFDKLNELSNGKLEVEKDAKLSEARDLIGIRRKKKKKENHKHRK
ncbi:MAG: DUF4290 domain-containing protein [Bacteroidota bacterium]